MGLLKLYEGGLTLGTIYKVVPNQGHLFLGEKQVNEVSVTDFNRINRLGWCLAVATTQDTAQIMYYVSTHTHSELSVLDGVSKVKDLAKTCVGAMALTDHGNMFGALRFQKAMKGLGKKPILGCEVYMGEPTEKSYSHLILIAKNRVGLSNLIKLVSKAHSNMYRKPRISQKMLQEHSQGLICTSACIGGKLPKLLLKNQNDEAQEFVRNMKELFQDDFYIEIQRHGIKAEEKANPLLINLAKEMGVKIIAGIDSHYLNKEDKDVHDIILAINDGNKLTDNNYRSFDGEGYHVLGQEETYNLFEDLPDALLSTLEVCLKIESDAIFELGAYHVPTFEFIPAEFKNDAEYLAHLIAEGYQTRVVAKGEDDAEHRERIAYEQGVILNMGFASYFLIVHEYINWAKKNGIAVGPGRGSAAGSLVSYCLGITELDPIKYGLLFERFLNPDRVSMPDIDTDFEDSRREEVIEHVRELYGAERVSNIITFGTMAAKSSIRDVANVYGIPTISSMVGKYIKPTDNISSALENPEFTELYNNNKDVALVINSAKRLEGNVRNLSTHACGILIAPSDVSDYLPTCLVGNSKEGYTYSSQFTMSEVEECGLLKMDFLGLKTMGVIAECLKVLRNSSHPIMRGVQEYTDIPLNDPYVYEEISKGQSYAVFQLESAGMRSFMRELFADVSGKIRKIEHTFALTGFGEASDITSPNYEDYMAAMRTLGDELFCRMIAGVSLYRPGPMDYIPKYIEGMRHPERITYITPQLEPILSDTYGVIVYQEQVMQIVRELAGFSKGQADVIRKAMGKKKKEILAEYQEYFIYGSGEKLDDHTGKPMGIVGCVANGIAEEIAVAIWDQMKDFAEYAFNKSHAAAYAVVTISTAWLKHYFPVVFMCSSMNVYINDDKFAVYLQVTKKMGIKVLPPTINDSMELFSVTKEGAILFGIKGIKGVNKSVSAIIREREENGPYQSEQDFTKRVDVNKKTLESLIYSGVFDCFSGTRAAKKTMVDAWLSNAKQARADKQCGQISLFDFSEEISDKIETPAILEMERKELLKLEKEYAGLYITAHPLDEYSKVIQKERITPLSFLLAEEEIETLFSSKNNIKVAGLVTNVKKLYTKRDNRAMAVFTIEDQTREVDAIIFADDYATFNTLLADDNPVVVAGTFQEKDEEVQMVVRTITSLETLQASFGNSKVYVKIESEEEYRLLEEVSRKHAGESDVYFQYQGKVWKSKVPASITPEFVMDLENNFGLDAVLLK